jgi:hypothetical protein
MEIKAITLVLIVTPTLFYTGMLTQSTKVLNGIKVTPSKDDNNLGISGISINIGTNGLLTKVIYFYEKGEE